jgi:hypothetical protein
MLLKDAEHVACAGGEPTGGAGGAAGSSELQRRRYTGEYVYTSDGRGMQEHCTSLRVASWGFKVTTLADMWPHPELFTDTCSLTIRSHQLRAHPTSRDDEDDSGLRRAAADNGCRCVIAFPSTPCTRSILPAHRGASVLPLPRRRDGVNSSVCQDTSCV